MLSKFRTLSYHELRNLCANINIENYQSLTKWGLVEVLETSDAQGRASSQASTQLLRAQAKVLGAKARTETGAFESKVDLQRAVESQRRLDEVLKGLPSERSLGL